MRIAAIADVHGNLLALEEVLADIERQGVDVTVNLGDHLSGPLDARGTADLLIDRGFLSVRGNHDRWLVEVEEARMNASDRAANAQMTGRHREWLAALPPTAVLDGEVFLCHGTPTNDTAYWLESVEDDGTVRASPLERVEAEAHDTDCPLILCGHTHIARSVRLRDGRLVVNPGSVGCPGYEGDEPVPHVMQAGTPAASYAILEGRGRQWSVCFRQLPYDHRAAARMARERGRPDWVSALELGWIV